MRRLGLLSIFLLLAACAALPPAGPPPDKALVHVYRRALPPGPPEIALFDGAQPMGHLTAGSLLDYLTVPGPRLFKAEAQGLGSLPYATTLTGGRTYWFMIYVLGDQLRGNVTLAPMDEATAEKQMAALKPAQP
ncbi:MAG: hypothetical protein ACM3ZT_10470 [Bacillota bacterium]